MNKLIRAIAELPKPCDCENVDDKDMFSMHSKAHMDRLKRDYPEAFSNPVPYGYAIAKKPAHDAAGLTPRTSPVHPQPHVPLPPLPFA